MWTAEQLNRLGKRWKILNHVPFTGGSGPTRWFTDLDHVAIGPPGVLAVSTKWTAEWGATDPENDPSVRAAADQLRRNANRLSGELRHAVPAARIMPLLVYWGPEVLPIDPAVRHLDDVRIVNGNQADEWRAVLETDRLTDAEIDTLHRVVTSRIAGYERRRARDTAEEARARRWMRRSRATSRVSAGLTMVEVAMVASARLSDWWNHALGRTLARGGGPIALLFFLVPLVGTAGSVAIELMTHRAARWTYAEPSTRKRLRPPIVSFAIWIGVVVVTAATK